jgi:Ion channel
MVGIHLWRNGMATLMLIVTLLTGHLAQVKTFAVAFYHSAVNYTTLGYGDLVMSEQWRLLGPQEAVSGTLAVTDTAARRDAPRSETAGATRRRR